MHQTYTFLALLACVLVIVLATCSAALELLELHGPDGQVVFVNPAEISSLRQPTSTDLHRYFPGGTHCVVVTGNGKFVASTETCQQIRDRLAR